MKYLKFYDLEETYINEKSSLGYYNVSYTQNTEMVWVKNEPQILEMKFKVIAHKEEMDIPASIEYNKNSNLFIGNKICNDFSIFKKLIINDGEPIDLTKGAENNIQINSETVYSDYDSILMTPLIYGSNKVQIILDEPLRENDSLIINFVNNPNNMMVVNENSEDFNFFFNKIDDLTYELTDEFINMLNTEYVEYSIFGLKEGAEPNDNGHFEIDCASYIINTTLKYYEIPDISLPMELDKEYIVKGELKDGIYSLPYGLFSNEFSSGRPESLNGTSDTNSNNIYCGQFINLIEINIPKYIYEISDSAFSNNISLKNITFESNNKLEYIGGYAFVSCSSLTSITIPESVISIGDEAFYDCSSLSEITIPNSVETIGSNAFYDCSSLSSVTFEEGSKLYSIGRNTFYNCDSLTSIIIPNSVTSIGSYTFSSCDSLISVTIPNSVKKIGDKAFISCSSLTDIIIPNSVTSIDNQAFTNCSSLSSVTFEEGSQCTSIGTNAFSECYSISEIIIPNSVTSIGNSAFNECNSLREITIGNSVTSINSNVFQYCTSLTSITIPESVTSISNNAFYNCSSLKEITIPNSVTSIGNNAFTYCTSLNEITCLATTAPTIKSNTFSSICSYGVLYYPQGSDYSSWLSKSNYYLGNNGWVGVELQDAYDFKVNFITNGVRVNSPYNLLIINGIQGNKQEDNSYLFSGLQPMNGCYKFDLIADGEVIDRVDIKHKNKWITVGDNSSMLTCIYNPCQSTTIYSNNNLTYSGAYVDGAYIGTLTSTYTFNDISEHIIQYSGVTSISNQAFFGCNSLKEITIPNSVTSIETSAFGYCKSLTSVTIGNSVTSIGNSAFGYCESLTSITIPESVTTIGNYAFTGCTSLSSIDIPESVTTIGEYAFSHCQSLTNITIPDSVTSIGNSAFSACISLTSITISNSVTTIGEYAFNYCKSLTSITIPESVTSISNNMFEGCSSLTSITIPESVTSIGEYAFYYCNSLKEITIPNSVTSIETSAFGYCKSLTSVTIGNSVTSISNQAFYYCSSLKEITIPNSVTSIGEYAFGHCDSLTSITIPNSVTSFGTEAFGYCHSLSEITFEEGSKLTSIGSSAFYSCTSLRSIEILDSVTSIGYYAFQYCYSLTSITIPNSVTSIGNSAFNECNSLREITFEEGSKLTSIGNGIFTNCYSLSSIEIPNNVTSIGDGAFRGCYSLSEITIPNSVTTFGNSVFDDCYSLKSVIFEEGLQLTSIGDYVFRHCYSLNSITIPDGVTSIGYYAFQYCYSLTSITIPNSVTSIGNSAFSNCHSLTSITIPNSVESIGYGAFYYCSSLSEITCLATTAPTISSNTFSNISSLGVVYYPGLNSSYDAWKQYLPSWDFVPLYTPQECTNLVISAENVNGRATSTTISYTATTNGIILTNNEYVNGVKLIGTAISAPFVQNTDTENEVIRTITFEYMGVTANTTITQGVWFDAYYTIDLNNQWQMSTSIPNPDSSLYDGVYESFSNKGVNNSAAICKITIEGYENFQLYVRSNGESCCDYVVVSNLDCTLSSGTTGGTSVKMTTQNNQQSGTAIGDYTLVEFSGIDSGLHTIQVMYRKDSSSASGTDQGYLLIPINQ